MHGSRPVRITNEIVERNIRQQRDLDIQRTQLAGYGKETANLMSAASAQTRIESQRRTIQQQQSRAEQIYEEQLNKSQYERKFRDLTATQNQQLANQLEREVADDERKRREIQKICDDAPELKELERSLKIAYLNKERAQQYQEKVLLATREQERIQAIEDEMEADRIRALKADAHKDEAKRAMHEHQRVVIQRQLEEKREQLAQARADIERERYMVDEIVGKINQEDEEEYRRRKAKQLETAEMVRRFEEQRRVEVEAARRAALEEEERINQYNRSMDARNEGIVAKKQAKKDEEDRILKQIVEETERKRREEEEFSNLRDMLWEEELEAKRAQEVQDRKMKQYRMKEEMMQANSQMMSLKEQMRLKEAENEARLVNVMRQKFAEDEARERVKEEARRQAKLHHMSLIERQKDQRKNLYEQEKQEEARLLQEAADREEYRQMVIREARKRLLEEHAARLQGYLPNKVFESKEEFEEYRHLMR
jgi:hypothetical protein